jgi:hypothetical protein
MDTYQPSTIAPAQARDAYSSAYGDGRANEREQWLPLAGVLRAAILLKHQHNGSLVLSLADVLAISAALARAEGA